MHHVVEGHYVYVVHHVEVVPAFEGVHHVDVDVEVVHYLFE